MLAGNEGCRGKANYCRYIKKGMVILLMLQKSSEHQLRLVVYPHYLQGFHTSQVVSRISAINRMDMAIKSLAFLLQSPSGDLDLLDLR